MKIIFHIDINAFFASVEEILNPNLKNKPIAVGGKNKAGIIGSANYNARKFGIKSAMPTGIAKILCPELIIVEAKMEQYVIYSHLFFHHLKTKFSKKIEVGSIDECFIDFTPRIKTIKEAKILALEIQNSIKSDLGLGVSIGISDNKFTAKMCSDIFKPEGICACFGILEFQKIIWPLKIEKFLNIGKTKISLLHDLKIFNIGDFATYKNESKLIEIFKNQYWEFKNCAWNLGADYVDSEYHQAKSISCATTFYENIDNYEKIQSELLGLCQTCAYKLKAENLVAKSLCLVVKYTHDKHLSFSKNHLHLCGFDEIYLNAMKLFDQNNLLFQSIKYLGVNLRNLKHNFNNPTIMTNNLKLNELIIQKNKNKKILILPASKIRQ